MNHSHSHSLVFNIIILFNYIMSSVLLNERETKIIDDDFLDWETRNEDFPLFKHIIAGIYKFGHLLLIKEITNLQLI